MTDYRETTGIGVKKNAIQTGAKAGDATLSDLVVSPLSPSPGSDIEVTATVKENITFMGYDDPDQCHNLGSPGIDVDLVVEIPELDRSNSANQCITVYVSQSGRHEFNVPLSLPDDMEDGDYTVEVKAKMRNTGNVIGEKTETINISEGGQTEPGPGECPDGYKYEDGNCVPENGDSGGEINYTKWILNNPGKAAIVGVGSLAVINTVFR